MSLGWNLRWCCMNMICRVFPAPGLLFYIILLFLSYCKHTHTHTHTQDMNRFAAVQLTLAVMLFFFCQPLDLHSCRESLGGICVSLSGCFRGRYYKEHNSQSQFSEIRMIPAGRDDKRTMLYKLCLVQVPELQRVLCCMKVLLGPLQWRWSKTQNTVRLRV